MTITINCAYGEGGGQIIRTAITLATVLGQPIRLMNIRAGRQKPGLAAQHLTAVRAAALICQAKVTGDELGSTELTFEPQSEPLPGSYLFDVAEARQGGSAGAATLVMQTILLPLALASEASTVTVRGGTHVNWSPSFHYFREVFLPMVAQLGLQAEATLARWGWYPAGEGEINLEILGSTPFHLPQPTRWQNRQSLQEVRGVGVAANLPSHIAQRLTARTNRLLDQAGLPAKVQPVRARSTSPGAAIFLTADYETSRAGFEAWGRRGKPSEQVAAEAVEAMLAFHRTAAVLDTHLTDQLMLPLALTKQAITVSAQDLTPHTMTNLWVVEQFLGPVARLDEANRVIEFLAR